MRVLERPWCLPPTDLVLSSDEIHVWRAHLDLPVSDVQRLQRTLTADELSRAAKFYFQRDCRRFTVARGLLRTILSRYLDAAPDQLRFAYGDHGKPKLATAFGQERLSFNLSHSGELALYSVTLGREIGIDVERVRGDLEHEQIAARFCSPGERAVLHQLPAGQRLEAFFNCWTRKEAYLKAKGEGLSMPLNQIDVSTAPGEPAKLLNTWGDLQEASRWTLEELIPEPGYVGALAVEGYGWRLTRWRWPD